MISGATRGYHSTEKMKRHFISLRSLFIFKIFLVFFHIAIDYVTMFYVRYIIIINVNYIIM